MNRIIFAIFLFVSSSSLAAGTSSNNAPEEDNTDKIKIWYMKAEKNIKEKKFKSSLKILKSLTKREDLSGFRADVYNLLGFSYRKMSKPDLDKSFAAYMMAIELDPNHVGAHEYLGELYLMINNKNKAIEMLTKLETLVGKKSQEYMQLKKAINEY